MLNLEYYLVNLSAIEKENILSTNTVIDNIMYCDKFREKLELADAVRTAYNRIQLLEEHGDVSSDLRETIIDRKIFPR